MHILVTGASGLLGINLSLMALSRRHQITGWVNIHRLKHSPFPVQSVDFHHTQEIKPTLHQVKADMIINCAAIANLEQAEENPHEAYLINSEVPGILAECALKESIPFIQISTDAVFDGTKENYLEEDQPLPQNVYASSKLAGEVNALTANSSSIVARVNFYGWSISGKRSLAEFFYNNLKMGNKVKGFTDVWFCPLYVNHLAEILLEMAEKCEGGIYHVVSKEATSKYDFGKAIAEKFDFNPQLIDPVSVRESGLKAQRSLNLILNNSKISKILARELPDQPEGLEAFHRSFLENLPEKLRLFQISC